jgi:hypothetical protein
MSDRKPYSSDVSDEQWALVELCMALRTLLLAGLGDRTAGFRPPTPPPKAAPTP